MKATSAQKDRIENARAYLATNDAAKPRLLQQILGESRESAHESLRINTCHDFAWSRKLWADAARQTAYIAIAATLVYLGLGFYLLAYSDGLRGVGEFWMSFLSTLGVHVHIILTYWRSRTTRNARCQQTKRLLVLPRHNPNNRGTRRYLP